MNELDTLKAFFKAWEAQQAMPAKKGRPGPEYKAADDLLAMHAQAVRNWRPEGAVAPVMSSSAQAFRALQQQIAAIPPKDTRGARTKGQIDITNG